MRTCLTCQHWNLDKCVLTDEPTTKADSCEQYAEEQYFTWAIFYDTPTEKERVFDLYRNKKSAQEEIDYLNGLGYTNIQIENLKENDWYG